MTRARLTVVAAALACVVTTGCAQDQPEAERARQAAGDPSGTPAPAPSRNTDVPAVLDRAIESAPVPATSPRQVVEQIVAAERAIADPRTRSDVLAAAGHLQQMAYRVLGNRPAWDRAVGSAVPADLRRSVADNVASRRAFQSMHPTSRKHLHRDLPAWRIVAPAPPKTLLTAYHRAESRFGVDWNYLAAINLVETGMGRIRGASVAGARGPMQFMPGTWAQYGRGDINAPADAIMAAGRYLRAMGFHRKNGIPRALYRYNNSWAYVRGVTRLARVMQRQPRAFHGYYHWQVYYLTRFGYVHLPEGFSAKRRIPVKQYLASVHSPGE